MFSRILIANRGEIALRILRTCQHMGIETVLAHSEADRHTPAVRAADRAICVGGPPVADSYLNQQALIDACLASGAEALHPGYGFLSENAGFAEALEGAGVRFIGPTPAQLRSFGLKHTARALATTCGVPLAAGSGLLADEDEAVAAADAIGYPVMLKSTAGGGGIGMQRCSSRAELRQRFAAVRRSASASFGDGGVFLERYVADARHVEVQVFGDGLGGVLALGQRDCSLQRRNQKVLEESPAPGLAPALAAQMSDAAIRLAQHVGYRSAGTVEFLHDPARGDFYFLEVNTRLQVEHPVTEAVFGIDLVEWMIRLAAGEFVLPPAATLEARGWAIEARLYAEDPGQDFRPSSGTVIRASLPPPPARVDGWIEDGSEVTPWYDPLLAKIIVHAADRAQALARLQAALAATAIAGIETNLDYLRAIAVDPGFVAGQVSTALLQGLSFAQTRIDVLAPGAQSLLLDWPGRVGYWAVGIPPSGPMDDRAFRLANRLLGNPEGALALECAASGPTLRFAAPTWLALTGADMQAELDGQPVPRHAAFAVAAGQVLTLSTVRGAGQRACLAVRGGFVAPDYLGACTTFDLGGFGGHAGRALRTGDTLHFSAEQGGSFTPQSAQAGDIAELSHDWELGVLYGPHGAPDFFDPADIDTLFSSAYEVHFNSARTGVRLIGPKPRWARPDGGEAGLHPSNIHDTAYAIGSIDFTGDMPIILGPDGPSLGGFVCPAVLAREEIWKLGQLRPGDRVRFRQLDAGAATPPGPDRTPAQIPALAGAALASLTRRARAYADPVVATRDDGPVAVAYRRAGDDALLVEYGPMQLDLRLRLRVQLLADAIVAARVPYLIDLTPGVRSLQIHYDGQAMPLQRLLAILQELEAGLPDATQAQVASRIIHLPLSWNDSSVRLAMRKYHELVRPDAPWCPDNIEFIRRINGLDSVEDVRRIVFDANYVVLGLGDVYLGAPVATPLDPRHRLVTTKYNPARTWTPENAVGIGGAYLCVYGMEGPGGYQLFGRTLQMWNRWRRTPAFEQPWLLRCFDQIRFVEVSERELAEARDAFPYGAYPLRIEPARFDLAAVNAALAPEQADIARFKARQQAAFELERADWKARGLDTYSPVDVPAEAGEARGIPAGCEGVASPLTGNVWKVLVAEGERVERGQTLLIIESMKMEVQVQALRAGRVCELRCQPGRTVFQDQVLVVLGEGPA